jgi:hypothetical protein
MVDLPRGFSRLAISLWVLWFVYWTCAYAMWSPASENHPMSLPLVTYVALSPFLIASASFGIRWVIAGFRPAM